MTKEFLEQNPDLNELSKRVSRAMYESYRRKEAEVKLKKRSDNLNPPEKRS